jgi:hypothetical protein
VAALLAANATGDLALFYGGKDSTAGARSPLEFVDGGGYAAANAEGFASLSFTTTQQVGFTATLHGADGALGGYLLDLLEVEALTNTTTGWHLALNVTQALAGTGINAAYLFYCLAAPTGVPVTGTAIASGTDAAGDPWSVFAPSCSGSQDVLSLTAVGSGGALALPKLTFGVSELYLSFAIDLSSSGASTTTAASVVLTATSP